MTVGTLYSNVSRWSIIN